MGHKTLETKSKELAFLLRHDKSYNFDSSGYRDVSDLIKNHGYTKSELIEIVESDNKGRYEFSEDNRKIRARQGHSVSGINPDLAELLPPPILYHGTATCFLDSIFKKGIMKQSRNHVHLSAEYTTAIKVGSRHGNPIVLKIDSEQMSKDGIKFWKSANNVWLTDYVDPKYFVISENFDV